MGCVSESSAERETTPAGDVATEEAASEAAQTDGPRTGGPEAQAPERQDSEKRAPEKPASGSDRPNQPSEGAEEPSASASGEPDSRGGAESAEAVGCDEAPESGSADSSGADGAGADSAGEAQPQPELPDTLTFRITRTTWVAVASVVVCATPVATSHSYLLWVYLLPIALGFWVARMRTTVGAEGVRVRTMTGTTSFTWDDVRSVKLNARGWSEAVLTSGKHVRLPAVRVRDLSLVSEMSRGRLPDPAR